MRWLTEWVDPQPYIDRLGIDQPKTTSERIADDQIRDAFVFEDDGATVFLYTGQGGWKALKRKQL
jgi:hypothetical protein